MFYTFVQNNSGGVFIDNEQVCHIVIIEADTADEANRLAETHGIYFHGIGDCPCCGDRWYEQWSDTDGTEQPSIYNEDPQRYQCAWTVEGEVYCRVYHKDGLKQEYRVFRNTPEPKIQRISKT